MNILQNIRGHIVSTDKYMNMATTLPSPLTTHVLNIAQGVPGANMTIILYLLDPISSVWNLLTTGITNDDGRCPGLIKKDSFIAGVYKLRFETGKYWDALGEMCFYPYVEVVFNITDPSQKYHIPLILSRFSYSTYRGS
ncbi:5-hydroxyisourate hydrolase isoform X2 [Pimephales promelas]|uniref:5-hydroxyisourate hydrolase isoform X2 n=1 Tax=Pimephales promelas TaxID=90988 RepID=UPI0019555733|nr:5-hydroxyisourate hydrolase isoform X2 [Pimephales promelas]KAG1946557.1 5-hydroxyisourate hydrolase [Pimephales promelas]